MLVRKRPIDVWPVRFLLRYASTYLLCYYMKGDYGMWFRAFRKPLELVGFWGTRVGRFQVVWAGWSWWSSSIMNVLVGGKKD